MLFSIEYEGQLYRLAMSQNARRMSYAGPTEGRHKLAELGQANNANTWIGGSRIDWTDLEARAGQHPFPSGDI